MTSWRPAVKPRCAACWTRHSPGRLAEEKSQPVDLNPLRAGMVLAADVEPQEVAWVWYPYLPRRFITMVFGDGDVRKSWLAMAIAAGVTRGGKVTSPS